MVALRRCGVECSVHPPQAHARGQCVRHRPCTSAQRPLSPAWTTPTHPARPQPRPRAPFSSPPSSPPPTYFWSSPSMSNVIDPSELKLHTSGDSAWVVIDGQVFDVTPFLDDVRLPAPSAPVPGSGSAPAPTSFSYSLSYSRCPYQPGEKYGDSSGRTLTLTLILTRSTDKCHLLPNPSPPL